MNFVQCRCGCGCKPVLVVAVHIAKRPCEHRTCQHGPAGRRVFQDQPGGRGICGAEGVQGPAEQGAGGRPLPKVQRSRDSDRELWRSL
jgi:hypothetical protein